MKRFMQKIFAIVVAVTMVFSISITSYGAEYTDETSENAVITFREKWDVNNRRD